MAVEYEQGENVPLRRLFGKARATIPAGESAVLDVTGCQGIVAYSAGAASVTATPCDAQGNALPGASGSAMTLEQLLAVADVPAHYYLVEVTTADAVVLVIS